MGQAFQVYAFLCGARDYHAMDCYQSAKQLYRDKQVMVVTDLLAAEGLESLATDDDIVEKLLIIDRFLIRRRCRLADLWRNVLKMAVLPIQAWKLKRFYQRHSDAIFLAHGMYYMRLAQQARVPYIGTPQGSEILVRPYQSKAYCRFATKALLGAKAVTVDSTLMQEKIKQLCGVRAHVIQYGIDLSTIHRVYDEQAVRKGAPFLSVRGIEPLYRTQELVAARNRSKHYSQQPMNLIYPHYKDEYLKATETTIRQGDQMMGRLSREDMYRLMNQSEIAFSIPMSDSSPRVVYEAVFMGCVCVIARNPYYERLPKCMQQRLVVADVEEPDWFDKAVDAAYAKTSERFEPTEEALEMFDQVRQFKHVHALIESLR